MKKFTMMVVVCASISCSTWINSTGQERFADELMQNSRTAFLGAFGMGIATSVARILDPVLNGVWRKATITFAFLSSCVNRGFNKFCRRPNGLESRTVRQWHDLVEQLVYGVCEVSKSGKLIMQMDHVQGTYLRDASSDWHLYVEAVDRIVLHIINDIERALPHYKGSDQERPGLGFFARSIALKDYQVITFILEELVVELHNIKTLCNNAHNADEINVDELNRIARVTLLLLKNLHTTIRDHDDEDAVAKSLGVSGGRINGLFP